MIWITGTCFLPAVHYVYLHSQKSVADTLSFPTPHSLSRHLLAVKQTSGALFSSVARHHLQVSVYESAQSLVWLLEDNVLQSYAYCRTSPRWPHQLLPSSFHLSYPVPCRHPRTWFLQQWLQGILPCRVCPYWLQSYRVHHWTGRSRLWLCSCLYYPQREATSGHGTTVPRTCNRLRFPCIVSHYVHWHDRIPQAYGRAPGRFAIRFF